MVIVKKSGTYLVALNVVGKYVFDQTYWPNPGVVACTSNSAALEPVCRNGVGSLPVGGNSSLIGG